jgi:hypothetical protein
MKPLKSHLLKAMLFACTVITLPAFAEHREHGAHVHGVGQLNVALDGTLLEIELDSPAANLVGFEHAPRNDTEKGQLEQAMNRLRNATTLFTLPADAGCRLQQVEVTEEGGEKQPDEDTAEHHSDIISHYRFECATPSALSGIDIHLFALFPTTEQLQVQLIGPHGQQGTVLTTQSNHLSF